MDNEKFEDILWKRLDKLSDKVDDLGKRVYLIMAIATPLITSLTSIIIFYVKGKM